MTPFKEASLPEMSVPQFMEKFGMTEEDARIEMALLKSQSIVMNDTYQVNMRVIPAPFPGKGPMVWLSIKRRDKEAIHDWRELQTIKNMLVGPECEGFEVYPAESRLADGANQYHLWVFVEQRVRLPVGFDQRFVHDEKEAAAVGAKQRPFDRTFEETWALMEAKGYHYGSDALEQVRLGWELAHGRHV